MNILNEKIQSEGISKSQRIFWLEEDERTEFALWEDKAEGEEKGRVLIFGREFHTIQSSFMLSETLRVAGYTTYRFIYESKEESSKDTELEKARFLGKFFHEHIGKSIKIVVPDALFATALLFSSIYSDVQDVICLGSNISLESIQKEAYEHISVTFLVDEDKESHPNGMMINICQNLNIKYIQVIPCPTIIVGECYSLYHKLLLANCVVALLKQKNLKAVSKELLIIDDLVQKGKENLRVARQLSEPARKALRL